MVRPKGTKKFKKQTYVHLKLEQSQKDLFEEYAKQRGMNISSFIRSTLLKEVKGLK